MQRVEERAPAKVNLALHVIGRRDDGYHELDSIVAFADVADELTLEAATETSLALSGPFAGALAADADNLVLKAHQALAEELQRQGKHMPPVAFYLKKNLPIASGIGGGSADAAAALRGLVQLSDIKLDDERLNAIALALGADVPVCLKGVTCRMRGVGEKIEAVDISLPPAIVLVNPLVSTSTPAVFGKLGLTRGQHYGAALDPHQPKTWRNDLANPAKALVPEVQLVLDALNRQDGLLDVRMSGSGATCFGLAASLDLAQQAARSLAANYPAWWVQAARLL